MDDIKLSPRLRQQGTYALPYSIPYALPLALPSATTLGGGEAVPANYFYFNGVDQYATIPGWNPGGLPYEISLTTTPANTTTSVMLGTDDSQALGRSSSIFFLLGSWFSNFTDQAGAQINMNEGAITPGIQKTPKATFTSEESSYLVTDPPVIGAGVAGTFVDGDRDFKIIGAGSATGNFYTGPIGGIRLIDNSPLQNNTYVVGDNTYTALLDTPFPVVGDFNFSFDWQRTDTPTGTSQQRMWSDPAGDNLTNIAIHDSGAGNPGLIQISVGGGAINNYLNALDDIQLGQYFNITVTRTAGTLRLYIDGVAHPTTHPSNDDGQIGRLGGRYAGASVRFNGPIGNFVFQSELDTSPKTYTYLMTEASGSTLINSDPITGSTYNGVWTKSPIRAFYPDRSRVYPMNEGSGTTFLAYDSNGNAVPADNATIFNSGSAGGGWNF
jgi:hypothetical protein